MHLHHDPAGSGEPHTHTYTHSHDHGLEPHEHPHVHPHDHDHEHTHEHSHEHSHEHTHEHPHQHPHEHPGCQGGSSCEGGQDCGSCGGCQHTPMEELKALMKYMVGHNASHAQELAGLARQLEQAGSHMAYEQVMQAVSDFEKGNLRLSMVLQALQDA